MIQAPNLHQLGEGASGPQEPYRVNWFARTNPKVIASNSTALLFVEFVSEEQSKTVQHFIAR
jgi:hypothetical protein